MSDEPLKEGQAFPGGWSVASVAPLRLQQRLAPELMRRIVVPIGPLLLGAFVIAASWNSHFGIKLAAWPVGLALLFIFVLGVLNLVRSVRRMKEGVRLEVSGAQVVGYPEARTWFGDYFVRLEQHARTEVTGVTLTVYRDPKRGTSSRAKIRVELADNAALVGPEASGDDAEWEQVRDTLLPAAHGVAQALGQNLKVVTP